ncbi:MAG: glycosyltransferase family 29 protein [Bacteroidetes bacterium]|nr:glycosyltransferase family 29 protein [Bacteroidota bacterium]
MQRYLQNLPEVINKIFNSNTLEKITAEDILVNCPKPFCVVGNAVIEYEFGSIIDSYATVIRMNNFKTSGYEKIVGSKTTLRCVSGWLDVENRNEHLEFSPFTKSANESKNLNAYNSKNDIPVITALSDVHKFIPEVPNPSTGFALIQLLRNLGIEADLFGFDGFKTNHYWEKDKPLNTTHSFSELDFILRRGNVISVSTLFPYQNIYDHCHSEYSDYNENAGLHMIRALNKNFSEKKILEFGAGNGDLSKYFEDSGNTVTAVEVSRVAFQKIPIHNKINGDVFSLRHLKDKYDVVVSIEVLEHLTETDIQLFLKYASYCCRECFLTVSTRPSGLLGPNGENLHATVRDEHWWRQTVAKYFHAHVKKGIHDQQYLIEGRSKNFTEALQSDYYIKKGYSHREEIRYFVDLPSSESGINYQPNVYLLAAQLAREVKANYIIDLGCGSGEKLANLHPEFKIIGVDFGKNIEHCRQMYPFGEWIDFDFESDLSIPIAQEILARSVIINSDVIEHVAEPYLLLKKISPMMLHAKFTLLSTPDRELNWGKEQNGPPPNPHHIREWTIEELTRMLSAYGFLVGSSGVTLSNDKEMEDKTILTVLVNRELAKNPAMVRELLIKYQKPKNIFFTITAEGGYERHSGTSTYVKPYLSSGYTPQQMKQLNVVAIISAHNEGDVIGHVIGALIHDGIQVYLLDHNSSDTTASEAAKWLGKGLLHIEKFPSESNYPKDNAEQYIWTDILKRKEEIALSLGADWYIHADADEFRESPWENMNLLEGIAYVDSLGYNAIDFHLLQFRPTNNNFTGGDVREYLRYYEEGESFNVKQIKAWKNLRTAVHLPKHGGHEVEFEGRKIFPIPFILRHYPIRNEQQGIKKIFTDRIPRFNQAERSNGWHVQYDTVNREHPKILYDESALQKYDGSTFKRNYLAAYSKNILELLSAETSRANNFEYRYSAAVKRISEAAKEVSALRDTADFTNCSSEVMLPPPEQTAKSLPKRKDFSAQLKLSDVYIKNHNYFDAYVLLQKILKEESSNEPAREKIIQLEEQTIAYRVKKNWNPQKSAEILAEAESYIQQEDLENAKSTLYKILNLEPSNIEALNDLSVITIIENNLSEAEELLSIILQCDPENEVALTNLKYLQNRKTESSQDDVLIQKFSTQTEYDSFLNATGEEQRVRSEQELSLVNINGASPVVHGTCIACNKEVDFLVEYAAEQQPNGKRIPNWRESVLCPSCRMNNRIRASIHFFEKKFQPSRDANIYLTEQTTALYQYLSRNYAHVIGSEYYGDKLPLGSYTSSGIRNEDITALTFPDNSLDFILSYEVLEHVPDFQKALHEFYRVLKPNGTLIFSAPFARNSASNIIRAVIRNGEIQHLLTPEYHGDPINSDGCLCFQHFGWEILENLKYASFSTVYAATVYSQQYGYLGNGDIFFTAVK